MGWGCFGDHVASSPLLLEGRKIIYFFCETVGGGGGVLLAFFTFSLPLFFSNA